MRFALAALVLLAASPAAADPAPVPLAPAPEHPAGALIGPALNVSDIARALHFYVDGLGMEVGARRGPPERLETILVFRNAGAGNLLLMADSRPGPHPAIVQGNGFDRVVMRIADLDATAARLRAAGFAPGAVHEAMNGRVRVMTATDPDGYRLELVEIHAMPAGGPR